MVFGTGSTDQLIKEQQIYAICAEAFARENLDNKKILALIPDNSRTAPLDMMFRTVYSLLANRVEKLDFLMALGTHPPMNDEAINRRLGITQEDRKDKYPKARFFNHFWKDPRQLTRIGTISEHETEEISSGLMHQQVDVTINRMVFDYDLLMIIGPTFPHEVVGFSGGNKYLFPGISGQEIINMFHWLGAFITIPEIIGIKNTPVRAVVDKAASFLPIEKLCLSLVVKGYELAGLFIGTPEEAWKEAADLSEKIHIIYKEKPFHSVLSCCPTMYDDLWTGGKCAYKLEPVVAEGGELIIYAPHIEEISVVHGRVIEKIGYHVRDYFTTQMEKFEDIPKGIMAHSTHVKGAGIFKDGLEKPGMTVTLATQIPEKVCKRINLGYRNPDSIDINDWKDQEDRGKLYVPRAGEMLYRLRQ